MKKSRTMLLSGLGAAVITGGLVLSTTLAKAQTSGETSFGNLAEVIAKKFNLDQAQVQATVDEFHLQRRSEMMAEMKQKQEERLSALVKEGKLTEAQKQAFLTKMQELAAQREANKDAFKDLTNEERKTQMEKKRTELKAWAESQGIDLDLIMPEMGMRAGHGFGKPRGFEPGSES